MFFIVEKRFEIDGKLLYKNIKLRKWVIKEETEFFLIGTIIENKHVF